jgi:hypothetical protein
MPLSLHHPFPRTDNLVMFLTFVCFTVRGGLEHLRSIPSIMHVLSRWLCSTAFVPCFCHSDCSFTGFCVVQFWAPGFRCVSGLTHFSFLFVVFLIGYVFLAWYVQSRGPMRFRIVVCNYDQRSRCHDRQCISRGIHSKTACKRSMAIICPSNPILFSGCELIQSPGI